MPSFTRDQIQKALNANSQNLSPEDVRRVSGNKDAVMKMVNEFPEQWAKARRQATLLFDLIRAAATGKINIHPDELKDAAGALIYLGAPVDIIPDDEKDGYSDDAAVVALAVQRTEAQIRAYCELNGLNASDYLD